MRDLGKVSSKQVFGLWKNLTVCLIALAATLILSKILPYYLSPIVALLIGSGLYFYIYNERGNSTKACMVPAIAILYNIVFYAFVTIILNLIHIWGVYEMPKELVFVTDPFIPALILNPVSFVILVVIYFNHNRMKICRDCRMSQQSGRSRGAQGVLKRESHLQLKNFVIVSGLLSLIVWGYYIYLYIDVNINARDAYIFTWLTVIGIAIDELFFSIRYYNLYLDLKESDELITPSQLRDMTAKTYLRFYVICGDYIYMTEHGEELNNHTKIEVLDTPFFTKQSMNGMYGEDVKHLITRMTGVDNGELRFFFGRKSAELDKHSLLRYFYFLNGNIEDYPKLETPGEWVKFEKIKYLYSNYPEKIAELAVYDITRLATIMLTEKIFDENGYRKSGIKSYSPSFNLLEVRKSKLDFQDDKWIRISLFNSDTKFYSLKKWWRSKWGKSHRGVS